MSINGRRWKIRSIKVKIGKGGFEGRKSIKFDISGNETGTWEEFEILYG